MTPAQNLTNESSKTFSNAEFLTRLLNEATEFVKNGPESSTSAQIAALLLIFALGLLALSALRSTNIPSKAQLWLIGALGLCFFIILSIVNLVSSEHPLLGFILVSPPLLAALFITGTRSASWWSGISLVISGKLKPGDQLNTSTVSGRFESAGLFRAVLKTKDEIIHLPWSNLSGEVTINPANAPTHLEVDLDLGEPITSEVRRRIEINTKLCPYRVWNKPTNVMISKKNPNQISVELYSWSIEGSRQAEEYLRRSIER